MNRLFSIAATLLTAGAVQAEPYCADLLTADALPKKYAKVAPIYSDANTGWVFTQDQLKDRYEIKATSQKLVQAIADEFARREVQLAIVVAPPRPVVAGQAVLNAAMSQEGYDIATARASFDKLIEGLASTGAIVPNLADQALASPNIRETFYFRRDTHWTTTGAAVSAIALSQEVNARDPHLFPNDGFFSVADLTPNGEIEEKGSLAEIVRMVCGASPAIESAPTFELARQGNLLGDSADAPSIALLGSSFSNRYKRDHYRFAETLARAFDADVENYSISGGGPIGAIEAYVLSGALDRREHELVVWELPYTESFNSVSFLRQLLGALRHDETPLFSEFKNTSKPVKLEVTRDMDIKGLKIETNDTAHQAFQVVLHFDDGSTSKIKLRRRNAVPTSLRSRNIYGSIGFHGHRRPVEIVVTPETKSSIARIEFY